VSCRKIISTFSVEWSCRSSSRGVTIALEASRFPLIILSSLHQLCSGSLSLMTPLRIKGTTGPGQSHESLFMFRGFPAALFLFHLLPGNGATCFPFTPGIPGFMLPSQPQTGPASASPMPLKMIHSPSFVF
jgi:hypothetical protein